MAAPRSLARAMETTTEAVSLPTSLPSSIEARGCLNCKSIRMELPETARFFIGKDEVTLKELRDFSLGKRFDMVILYELDSYVVQRVVLTGKFPSRAAIN